MSREKRFPFVVFFETKANTKVSVACFDMQDVERECKTFGIDNLTCIQENSGDLYSRDDFR